MFSCSATAWSFFLAGLVIAFSCRSWMPVRIFSQHCRPRESKCSYIYTFIHVYRTYSYTQQKISIVAKRLNLERSGYRQKPIHCIGLKHCLGHHSSSSSSSLSISRRGLLRRSRMTSSDSISPHVSGWTVVVANLVQPSLVGATWTTLPQRVR